MGLLVGGGVFLDREGGGEGGVEGREEEGGGGILDSTVARASS